MRVLHVIPAVSSRYGGPSSALGPMCRSLIANNIDTFVATTDADGSGRLDVPRGTPTTWEGVPAIFFRRDCTESFKYSYTLGRWLRQHVADFDVVHAHAVLSYAPVAAASACRANGVPYVVRPLGTLDGWSLRQKHLKKKLFLAFGGARTLRDATAIHYTSAEEKRQAESALGIGKGIVIPLGIDEQQLLRPGVTGDERRHDRYVLVVSRLHPVKNLEALITAFAAICRGRTESAWRLIIAGGGDADYTASLKRAAGRLSVEDRVSFVGWTEGEAKRRLIERASLFALPSFHENFGMSLVEAMAMGVPALVSREVHLAESIEASGAGWVTATDEASVRAGLIEAMSSDDARETRGRAARDFARTFSWTSVAAQLSQLYLRIASRADSPLAGSKAAVA
jgi:glycosyltransferase involved in cell wall biosynthesis